jgi:trehalose synthase
VGWRFLQPFVEPADRFVFSQLRFAPGWMDTARVREIMPSIDPFSAKNAPLEPELAKAVLQYVGLLAGHCDPPAVSFARRDGSPGRIDRHVDILQTGPPPPADAPLVAQLSRWDRLKDMPGVVRAFAEHVDRTHGAHLVLAGPAVHGVADDPEAAGVLDDCETVWRSLPESARAHVHLACVPMHDPDEAAVIANALQRHATVVTQKSIAEGFGLTVVEAMWKHRPVVASRVGGIVAQVRDGENGLLVDDPEDLAAFGAAVDRLLGDADLAHRLGDAAYRTAHEEFLGDRHLERWAALFGELLD